MDYRKLAPSLARAYDTYVESGREALAAYIDNHSLVGFVTTLDTAKPARVVVTLMCGPDAAFDDLTDTGIEFHKGGQRVRTAIVPMDALEQLANHPGVVQISSGERLHPHLDIAATKVGLPGFLTRTNSTGKGVIIGIVDSGINSTHPDFGSRVQRIWDQTLTGTGVPEGKYGVECTGADLTKSQDTNGHGTHTAGIAAGAGTQYRGVAPEADLVIVKTDWNTSHAIDALHYLARVAKDANKPLVVNLSLGYQQQPHDGTDELSVAVDETAASGVIVCCSAGNEGSSPIRAAAEVGLTEVTIPCNYGFDEKYGAFAVFGWYPSKDEIEIAFEGPSGARTPFQEVIPQPPPPYKLDNWDIKLVNMVDPRNKDHYLGVEAVPPTDAKKERSFWKLVLRGKTPTPSHVDVWCAGDVYLAGPGANTAMTIASPGCAQNAITVGAYITRKKWTDINKLDWQSLNYTENGMAPFSSQGPLRNGMAKPNVVAPGAVIVSCLSSTTDPTPSSENTPDKLHTIMEGTSLSSAFITGVVALLLQKEPTLDWKAILSKFAYNPKSDTKHDKYVWGAGLVDLDQMGKVPESTVILP